MTQAARAMVMLLKGRSALLTSSGLFIVMQGKAKDHFRVETLFQNMEGQGGEKEGGMKKGMPYSGSNSREQVNTDMVLSTCSYQTL